MKIISALFLLLAFSVAFHYADAQPQDSSPDDYAYLRRMHVPGVVVNCVAAFDRWVRTTPRYDLFVISERHALKATILKGRRISRDTTPLPVDTVVKTSAFAKVRGKYVWMPVKATCNLWHGHVIGLSAQPVNIH